MNMKKLFLLNLPYLLFVYPFDKLAQAFRLAPGSDLSGKLLSIGDGFTAALSSPWLSFHPTDLLIGIAGAVILRMAVYLKGKNAKKYRHGIEYGSARWGTAADIAPYMDKNFFQNIPMTQTERITMASRPKQPKYARNKNILVIGGSGSGKTRFFCKPSLLQAHSSYVCTDPKGTLLPEIGTFLERKKYHVDFALKKDTAAEQPRYLVFFKSRDADAITAAFQEFASRKMSREKKPSIRDRLTQAKEQAAEKTEHRTIDREKVKVKDRSVQR